MKKFLIVLVCLVVFVMSIGTLSSCGSGETTITNLTYNGEVITWTSVKNAKSYRIIINNGTESIVAQAKDTVVFRYDSNGQDFDFFIEAVIKEGSEKNPTYQMRFQNIGKVSGLSVKDGLLTWDAIADAEKYEIMYNGDVIDGKIGTTEYKLEPGEFSCKVRAYKGIADSVDGNIPYYSLWSEAFSGTLLDKPINLSYDSEVFTWEKVNGATAYTIKIGNEETVVNANRYEYVAGEGNIVVSVSAIGNSEQKIYNSQYCEPKEYTYIAPITDMNVVDGVLKWTASENATRYKIKVNGIVNNELLTANEYSALSNGTSYRIQLMPIGKNDSYFSRWSDEMTINILRSPSVTYGDNVIRWNQVTGASGYEVKIKKGDAVVHSTTVGNETFVYNYAFDDAGDYLVYVKATSLNTGGIYESKYSNAYSVKRLGTPTNEQVINRPLEQNQVSIAFTPVAGAAGYALLADDVEISTIKSGSAFSVDLSKLTNKVEESVVNFKIVARGSVTTSGAILDCKVPLEVNVTKLATPQNITMSGNQISWDSVNHTSKYILTIDGKRTELTTTSFTLTDLAAGVHSVCVQAMGNGEDVITGGFSDSISFKKLATPSSLVITNGLLTWGTVADATAYKVVLGTETYNADTTSFDLLGYMSYISEGTGTQISVYAIGNGTDIVDSDVSATKTISRYNRPTNVKVNGDNLVWNPSAVNSINCNSYKLIISKDGVPAYERVITGSSYSMSNFEAGNYSVKVIANGDNNQTIDSPESDEFVFTKLEAVSEVIKDGDTYTWDAVIGATAYEIKLSKDATWTTINTNSYTPNFTTEGAFEVSIRAIGNGNDIIDSNVYSFTQRVSRFTQPVRQDEMTNFNAFKIEVNGNTITVTAKKQDGATDYRLFVGGIDRTNVVSETSTEIVFSYTMTTVGATYKIQLQVCGNQFATNGNYMIDSNKSTEISVIYEN